MKNTAEHQVPKSINIKLQNGAQLCKELGTASNVTA